MKKKYMSVAILFLLVGFAAVSTTLYLSGSTNIIGNKDDFKVYYSDAKVNGEQDLTIVVDDTHLFFETELDTLGQTYVIEYDVTNSSKNYDADLEMVCTGGDTYLTVTNEFEDETSLPATETRVGTLTLTLAKTYVGDAYDVNIECTITANAVERTSLGTGTSAEPAICLFEYEDSDNSGDISVGDEYTYCNEKFNVISETANDVTMLAKYNIGTNYRQSTKANYLSKFSDSDGWAAQSDIDIQQYDGNAKTYVNEYVSFLRNKTGDDNISGTLITMDQLSKLGCMTEESSRFANDRTCTNSQYTSWLINGQDWWTRSAFYDYTDHIMQVRANGTLRFVAYSSYVAIRPVVTISKDTLNNL